jgi:hypothetical protein
VLYSGDTHRQTDRQTDREREGPEQAADPDPGPDPGWRLVEEWRQTLEGGDLQRTLGRERGRGRREEGGGSDHQAQGKPRERAGQGREGRAGRAGRAGREGRVGRLRDV